LRTVYDLTPEQYRQRWGLSNAYPMVAPNYALRRSQLAKSIGLEVRSHKLFPRSRRASVTEFGKNPLQAVPEENLNR
jgi:predicted transcriptional regulator